MRPAATHTSKSSSTRSVRPRRGRALPSLLVVASLCALAAPAWAQGDAIWTEGGQSGISAQDPLRFDTIRNLAESLSPAVVNISVSTSRFGPRGVDVEGEGSGFIINPDGYILTNNHVVENAQTILVRLVDGVELYAEVVGTDPRTDVALIKVDPDYPLPTIPLGDSDELHVGDWVVAIGSPLGLDFTVTHGIVSALERREIHPDGRDLYENFIQTDASINPGNSGGPLINIQGEVIGINTAVNRMGQGIGFAIPINMVKLLVPQLLETGTVRRSCIGVSIQAMSRELAGTYGLSAPRGALVRDVNAGGPGEVAGILPGDVILTFDGEDIEEADELPWLASVAGVGREVEVGILRAGDRTEVDVVLGELPCTGTVAAAAATPTPSGAAAPLGVQVSALDSASRLGLGLPGDVGILVEDIATTSPAHGSGLRVGDVILEVGSAPVSTPTDFVEEVGRYGRGDIVRLRIRRGTAWVFIAFTL